MEKIKKLNFFRKIKIAIFNLEKYGILITERLNCSIKYIMILILICTFCFTAIDTNNIFKMIKKGMDYISNEISDFEVINGEINIEGSIYGYDEEYDVKIISVDKTDLTNKELEQYEKDGKVMILLKDKIVLSTYGQYMEYSYNSIKKSLNIEEISKQGIIDLYEELGGDIKIIATIFMTLFLIYFVSISYQTILYVIMVAVLGYLVAQIAKIRIKFSTSVTLAIYSLTLSIILNLIYIIQYNFTGFEIPYFEILYLGIGYIYIIAAILIIKTDLIKQVIELQKIQKINPEVLQDQNEEKKQEKEEKNKEDKKKDKDKKEDNKENEVLSDEPDGSEI